MIYTVSKGCGDYSNNGIQPLAVSVVQWSGVFENLLTKLRLIQFAKMLLAIFSDLLCLYISSTVRGLGGLTIASGN
ncbi:hypothetical protein CY34DRAFT_602843 [Suillus luteus UH-Slu-Lm8-n1]|uniref:Uncharacterized protein n=1 Tax=Suillus luteus UH-Slu-Lm8-n1 TaxID=930992 RepID=A0A0D0A3T9_9AGAM|nr:hypothetical protein CY34DRAFT_602843 [Suillus luteus UH-Slu-Lm8-n1]